MVFGRWDRVLGWCFGFWVGFRWLAFEFYVGRFWVLGGCFFGGLFLFLHGWLLVFVFW